MAFPTTHLTLLVELAFGADVTAAPGTWSWTNVTDYCRLGNAGRIQITRGRPDQSGLADTSKITMTVDNTDGRWASRNPTGAWFGQIRKGVPIRVSAEGHVRFTGFLSALPPRWDLSERDRWVDVEAQGLLYRMTQGRSAARSALRRAIPLASPVHYWALESDPLVGGFLPVVGSTVLSVAGDAGYVGVSDPAPGSAGGVWFECYAPDSGGDPDLAGRFAPVALSGLSATKVSIAMIFKGEFGPVPTTASWHLPGLRLSGGTRSEIVINAYAATTSNIPNANFGIDVTLDSSQQLVNNFSTSPNPFDGLWHSLLVTVQQSGADVIASATLDGVAFVNTLTGGVGETLGTPIGLTPAAPWNVAFVGSDAYNNVGSAINIAHLAVWGNSTPLDPFEAMDGFIAEQAHDRFDRLGTDEGVRTTTSAVESQQMGSQGVKPLLELLRECEATDQGYLYEGLDFDLVLQSLAERYNMGVSLALNYTTAGHIAPPLQPTDDDRWVINDVTVERDGGPSTQVTEEDANVELSVPNIGRRDEQVTLSLAVDEQTAPIAAWRLYLGTWPGYRYPALTLNLAAAPSLIADWCATPLGGRITVANPPVDLRADPVDLVVEGYTETLNFFDWDVEINCSLAIPYNVGALDSGRLAAVESTTNEALDTTETGVDVANADSQWSTAGVPYDTVIGGEQMTVTAATALGATQTLTVTRSVNAVVKSHSTNAEVQVYQPMRLARG